MEAASNLTQFGLINSLRSGNLLIDTVLLLCFALSTIVFWAIELKKLFIGKGKVTA